ncbi:MAG: phosphotransferase, partial [Patescibacteria group bacterium]
EVLENVVQEATASKFISAERIMSGEVNEVYDVTLPSEKHVIVRISRNEGSDFGREVWAIDQVKKVGVPVPDMLLVTTVEAENADPLNICVQNKLEGEPLERGKINYGKLEPELLRSYMRQAGEILAKIHSIPVHGFDSLNELGQGPIPSFQGMMSRHLDKRDQFEAMIHTRGMDAKVMERVFNLLQENIGSAQEIQPVLTHSDFGPKHMMVDGEKITGIIDWGGVTGHSPIHDFAGFKLWYPEIPFDAIQEGYSNKELFNNDFERKLQWIALDNTFGALEWYDKNNYDAGIQYLLDKMREILEQTN